MGAVVYLRISDDRTGEGLGVARQERECRALCERNGWEVAEVITDNDVSAYRGRRRPGYQRLLDGLRVGRWDAVVCWHPDRLHRSPIELEGFIDLIDATDVSLATVSAGHWDLTTPSGRLVARQLGAVARYESEHKAERHRLKHDELFKAGKPSGGDRSFGYGPDLVTVVPAEADAIRWAAQHLLDGGSLRSICTEWTRRGVSTRMGGPWRPWVVRRVMCSARIAGYRERDGERVRAVWEPIVEWETVVRLRAVLTDPGRRRNLRSRRYLLTGGLAVCGLCGRPLVARPKADGRRCYVCASGPGFWGCGKIRLLADRFEADVRDRLLERLSLEQLPTPTDDPSPLVARLAELEAHQAELAADFYAHRTITRAQFVAASDSLGAKIETAMRDLARVESSGRTLRLGDPLVVAGLFDDLDIDAKRAVLAGWVEAVVVGPAVRGRNFYDRERVSIRWA